MIECKSPPMEIKKIMRYVFFIFALAIAAPIYAATIVEEIVARVGK